MSTIVKLPKRECGNCQYFWNSPNGGRCRLSPPVAIFTSSQSGSRQVSWYWPEVERFEWCGQFIQSSDKVAELNK